MSIFDDRQYFAVVYSNGEIVDEFPIEEDDPLCIHAAAEKYAEMIGYDVHVATHNWSGDYIKLTNDWHEVVFEDGSKQKVYDDVCCWDSKDYFIGE